MKIQSINSNYNNHNSNSLKNNNKKLSFGYLNPTAAYKSTLIARNLDSEVISVADLAKKALNIKQLLNYDRMSPARRLLIDEFLSYMPEAERENLTVDVCALRDDDMYHRATSSYRIIKDDVSMIAKLPKYDSKENKLVYKDVNLGFQEKTDSFIYESGHGDIENTIPVHNKKIMNKGLVLGHYNDNYEDTVWYHEPASVLTPVVFDYIAQKINELIDANEAARISTRDEKINKENISIRKQQLEALFD